MTPNQYRRLALSFPDTVEMSHMDHPDFRVGGKIFATIWKEGGVIMLKPEQQALLMKSHPAVFSPASGGWGRRGATVVNFEAADEHSVREGLKLAYSSKASKLDKSHR